MLLVEGLNWIAYDCKSLRLGFRKSSRFSSTSELPKTFMVRAAKFITMLAVFTNMTTKLVLSGWIGSYMILEEEIAAMQLDNLMKR